MIQFLAKEFLANKTLPYATGIFFSLNAHFTEHVLCSVHPDLFPACLEYSWMADDACVQKLHHRGHPMAKEKHQRTQKKQLGRWRYWTKQPFEAVTVTTGGGHNER